MLLAIVIAEGLTWGAGEECYRFVFVFGLVEFTANYFLPPPTEFVITLYPPAADVLG